MLGYPEAAISQALDVAGEFSRLIEGYAPSRTLANPSEFENR